MNNNVFALAASGSELYAGGEFTTAADTNANYIAKWNGSAWSAVGSGMDRAVRGLAVSGSDLYAGGGFSTAGGIAASNIAKWDGSNWSALGSGMNGDVLALAASGTDLYAAGAFTTAGGTPANRIAKWNGTNWSPLGSGLNGGSSALAVSSSELFTGGEFTIVGGKVSAYVARAFLELPTLSALRSGDELTLSWQASFETFALQQNPNAANSNTWSNANYPLTTNGPTKSATVHLAPTNQFFRLTGN